MAKTQKHTTELTTHTTKKEGVGQQFVFPLRCGEVYAFACK